MRVLTLLFMFVLLLTTSCAGLSQRTIADILKIPATTAEVYARQGFEKLPDLTQIDEGQIHQLLEDGGLAPIQADACVEAIIEEGPCVAQEFVRLLLEEQALSKSILAFGTEESINMGLEAAGKTFAACSIHAWAQAHLNCQEGYGPDPISTEVVLP